MRPLITFPSGALFRKVLKIAGLVLGIFLIVSFVGIQYTSRPRFCTTCHFMQPYYDSWRTSAHSMVSCIDCHFTPSLRGEISGKTQGIVQVAKYFTGSYGKSRPWVEISDESCLRSGCHETRLLAGKTKFGSVDFDHTPHLLQMRRGKKLRCTSCHSQIVQGLHLTVTKITCFLCHFKETETVKPTGDCKACHPAPTSRIVYQEVQFDHKDAVALGIDCQSCHVNMVQGTGVVDKGRCFACHTDPKRLNKYNDVDLMHLNHVTNHKVDCFRCHDEIRHQIVPMAKSADIDCGLCHPNQHSAQRMLFQGLGAEGVPGHPDPMFLTRVACTGCHTKHKDVKGTGDTTMYADGSSCANCHGPDYGAMVSQWKKTTENLLGHLLPALTRAKSELQKHKSVKPEDVSTVKYRQAKAWVDQVENNIRFVYRGGGVHNIRYATNILTSANQMLTDAMELINSPFRPTPLGVPPAFAESKCYSCHVGIENKLVLSLEGTVYFPGEPAKAKEKREGKTFPHRIHLTKARLACEKCHAPEIPRLGGTRESRHGALTITPASCSACHHQNLKADCTTCHGKDGPVKLLTYRTGEFLHKPHIVDAGLQCTDCHNIGANFRAIKKEIDCSACHEFPFKK